MGAYAVSRSIIVNAPPERIHSLIARFPEWRKWSPFEDRDANHVRDYRGQPEGVGAIYEYSGDKRAGAGVMAITDSSAHRVLIHLSILRPVKSESDHSFDLEPNGAATLVTWTMTGQQGAITSLVFPMHKVMGPIFEKGLANLKQVAEG